MAVELVQEIGRQIKLVTGTPSTVFCSSACPLPFNEEYAVSFLSTFTATD